MKKCFCLLSCVILLASCEKKPDYIINQNAFCDIENEISVCKDKDGNNINGYAYEENEKFKAKLNYRDGKRDGKQKFFYLNGKPFSDVFYKEGVIEGKYQNYYENGKKKSEKNYVNGEYEGTMKEFYPNGNLKLEFEYKAGKQIGLQKIYYEAGGIERTFIMTEDGEKKDVKRYNENGTLAATVERIIENSKFDGTAKTYTQDGKIQGEVIYDKGIEVKTFVPEYDDNGNVLYKTVYDKNDKEIGILYNDKMITRTQLNKELDLADCEQAVQKAIDRRKFINKDSHYLFKAGVYPNKKGLLQVYNNAKVVDFASDGVFLQVGSFRAFIYTKNTDYASGETFKADVIYEKVGNYKYTTLWGGTNSVPAFKATQYKISEINPKHYLRNKKLSCCQYVQEDTTGFGEIGVVDKKSFLLSDVPMTGKNSGEGCITRKHPNSYGGDQITICTGTDIY